MKHLIHTFLIALTFLTFNNSKASDPETRLNEVFTSVIDGNVLPNIGDSIAWGNGTLKRTKTKELLYTSVSGGAGCASIVFNGDSLPKEIAKNCPNINTLWKNEFGVDLAEKYNGVTLDTLMKERTVQVTYTQVINGIIIPKIGETLKWANGVLTRTSTHEVRYTSETGGPGCTSLTFTPLRAVADIAIACPNINAQWKGEFGIDLADMYKAYKVSGDASAYAINANFSDLGLKYGKVRSDFGPGVGSAAHPLSLVYPKPAPLGCAFSMTDEFFGCSGYAFEKINPATRLELGCGGDMTRVGDTWLGCTTYRKAPYFEINKPTSQYLAVVANSEPAFDQCNDGPPGLSQKVTDPLSNEINLYKVGVEDISSSVKRAHMAINMTGVDYNCARKKAKQLPIPFLSVGAHNGHGQNGPVAYMNRSAKTNKLIKWTGTVQQYRPFACTPGMKECSVAGVHSGVYAISKWNGVNHLVFIDFIGEGAMETLYDNTHAPKADGSDAKKVFWNWPIAESFYYPGAELAYLTTTSLEKMCGIKIDRVRPKTDKSPRNYELDITKIFSCVSDKKIFTNPMPLNQDVALEGFHWYMETIGSEGELWESFENTRAEF